MLRVAEPWIKPAEPCIHGILDHGICGTGQQTNLVNGFAQILFFTCLLLIIGTSSPAQDKSSAGVERSMKTYDQLILGMDPDSIALIYSPDGELGNMAKGRDSIRTFLSGFKNFRVLSQSSETERISIDHDSAFQTGTYRQTVILPAKDTVTVKGSFTALWIWMNGSGWRIRRMETQPAK
jgi:hypothetical protein